MLATSPLDACFCNLSLTESGRAQVWVAWQSIVEAARKGRIAVSAAILACLGGSEGALENRGGDEEGRSEAEEDLHCVVVLLKGLEYGRYMMFRLRLLETDMVLKLMTGNLPGIPECSERGSLNTPLSGILEPRYGVVGLIYSAFPEVKLRRALCGGGSDHGTWHRQMPCSWRSRCGVLGSTTADGTQHYVEGFYSPSSGGSVDLLCGAHQILSHPAS